MGAMLEVIDNVADTEFVGKSSGPVAQFDPAVIATLTSAWEARQTVKNAKGQESEQGLRRRIRYAFDTSSDLAVQKTREEDLVKKTAHSLGFTAKVYGAGLGWLRELTEDGKDNRTDDGRQIYSLYVRPVTTRVKVKSE